MPLITGKIIQLAVGVATIADGDFEGSWRALQDVAARDALALDYRSRGMVVYLNDGTNRFFQLRTPTLVSPPDAELLDNGNWVDITSTGGGGSGLEIEGAQYTCPTAVSQGDAVYVSGTNTVDRVVAAVSGQTPPARGIVRSKPTTTEAVVVTAGEVGGYGGLVVGDDYYLDPATPGGITNTPPSPAGAGGELFQRVGTAVALTTIFVGLSDEIEL